VSVYVGYNHHVFDLLPNFKIYLYPQVSDELIRVAILWHELWHEGLEEASRLYFGERNVKGMFDTLEPLHAMIHRGAQTLKETSFNQVSLNVVMKH
jgi:phosphatidylinositol kinase/protein kinase (PI-3  family)